MLLNRDQIQAMGLVQNPTAKSYRPASYDLQVGKIIDKSGKVVDSIEIPPQGMVRVISRERVKLPVDVIGNATVRTGLCDDGILAINIGIIDPGYEGLISSTLINFGRTEFPIKDGEVFLRLTFHQITPCKNPVAGSGKPDDEYVQDKIKLALRSFSTTFLNVEETATQAAKKVVGSWWARLLVWASILALLITAITSLATTYNAMTATRTYINSDQEQLKADVKDLRTQIGDLKQQLPPKNPQPPADSPPKPR
ncbi:MAG: hypothetical protein WBX13_08120 [Candidatus Acidiferrales bacterium]